MANVEHDLYTRLLKLGVCCVLAVLWGHSTIGHGYFFVYSADIRMLLRDCQYVLTLEMLLCTTTSSLDLLIWWQTVMIWPSCCTNTIPHWACEWAVIIWKNLSSSDPSEHIWVSGQLWIVASPFRTRVQLHTIFIREDLMLWNVLISIWNLL